MATVEPSEESSSEFEGGTAVGHGFTDMQQLTETVQRKVDSYDPTKAAAGEESEFTTTETIGFWEMITRQAGTCDKCLLALGTLAAAIFGGTMPVLFILWGDMIDGIAGADGMDTFKWMAIQFIYVGLVAMAFSSLMLIFFSVFASRISFKTRIHYFEKCLEKDAAFYDEHSPAEMSAKIAKECSAINRGLGEKVGQIVMSIFYFLLSIIIAFWYGWKLSLILCGALPLMMISGVAMAVSMGSGIIEEMRAYAQSAGYCEQALGAIRVVHTYGQERLEERNYTKYLDKSAKAQRSIACKQATGLSVVYLLFLGLYAYSFYFGGYLAWNQTIAKEDADGNVVTYSGGLTTQVMFLIIFGTFTLANTGPYMKAVTEGRIAAKLAYTVIDQEPLVNPHKTGAQELDATALRGEIVFQNVDFLYPSRQDLKILKDFTCTFEAGKTSALVGPSGSGKSTIIQLVERFYKPNGGTILVDGINLADLNLQKFRQLVGYVGQEPVLFNCSIKENMLFAKPDASDAEIKEALQAANAWDFIRKKMTTGIETQVGGSGGQLSGGQKQRIAIARAFLKKPRILLLDEATSALDTVNERAVQDAIDRYRKQAAITILVIAHRLSTIRDADKIVVVKDGVLTEQGNHEALLQNYPDGIYSSFCQKQAAAEESNQQPDVNEDELDEVEAASFVIKRGLSIKVDPEEQAMKKTADKQDKEIEETNEKFMAEQAKIGGMTRLSGFSTPCILIPIGMFGAAIVGISQPATAVIMTNVMIELSILSFVPVNDVNHYLLQADNSSMWYVEDPLYQRTYEDAKAASLEEWGYDAMIADAKSEICKWCILMGAAAGVCFIASWSAKASFGHLGSNVTTAVRTILYHSILEKHIGWFDLRDNGVSVLTSAMAQDTSQVNGTGTESLGPSAEAAFALLGGIGIALGYCWQQSLICLAVSPALVIGQVLEFAFMKGLTDDTNEATKGADLLCGDAIMNYRTVQSFGYEHLIVKKYKDMIQDANKDQVKTMIKVGLAFGTAQFFQFIVFAAMFYSCGEILDRESRSDDPLKVEAVADGTRAVAVLTATFAIMFGAMQAATASAMGPDMGKCAAAATRIFKIMDFPSAINAMKIEEEKTGQPIDKETFTGKVEFRNVWFRYPTRKEDFVLRGLNLTINPQTAVALVGESGCGKSTFVNLVMRFYDVDFGEVLIDDKPIQSYDLHDLRRSISLVMQEPIIFNYTILENVLYGKPHARNTEVYAACELAYCNDFILDKTVQSFDDSAAALKEEMVRSKLKIVEMIGQEKYEQELDVLAKIAEQEAATGTFEAKVGDVDTREQSLKDREMSDGFSFQCGLKGGKLSGGQKQRVAIARTVIREPRILILDEATSALDEDSQKKVQTALENAKKGRTTIIIAHRMSTIEQTDYTFVLDNGKVKEEGKISDLKAKGDGYFADKK